jgi:hypothetical protein
MAAEEEKAGVKTPPSHLFLYLKPVGEFYHKNIVAGRFYEIAKAPARAEISGMRIICPFLRLYQV